MTLGLATAGVFIRLIRVNVIRTLRDDYIEAARARGINERDVVYHHAFKNALVPVITVVGLNMALLLGGAVLTETTFNWPGHRPRARRRTSRTATTPRCRGSSSSSRSSSSS